MGDMSTAEDLQHRASELAEVARSFHESAQRPGSYLAAPAALESLEEALRVLSGALYQLAADAAPGIVEHRDGAVADAGCRRQAHTRSREQEMRLMGTLHEAAAAFARCARACRDARATAMPIIRRRTANDRDGGGRFPRFRRHERPTAYIA